jgi:hypothetical protein
MRLAIVIAYLWTVIIFCTVVDKTKRLWRSE